LAAEILQAQYRLGHSDAYTTLRIYSHAQPLHDVDAADTLDELYRRCALVREVGRTPNARPPWALAQIRLRGNAGAYLPERSRAAVVPLPARL